MKNLHETLKEVTDIKTNLWEIQDKIEEMLEDLDIETKKEFTWAIENGFVPGAIFKADFKPDVMLTVQSYSFDLERGPSIVFSRKGKLDIHTSIEATKENIDKFTKEEQREWTSQAN